MVGSSKEGFRNSNLSIHPTQVWLSEILFGVPDRRRFIRGI